MTKLPRLPGKVVTPSTKSPIIVDRLAPPDRRLLLDRHICVVLPLRLDDQSQPILQNSQKVRKVATWNSLTPIRNDKPQALVLDPPIHGSIRIQDKRRLLLEELRIEHAGIQVTLLDRRDFLSRVEIHPFCRPDTCEDWALPARPTLIDCHQRLEECPLHAPEIRIDRNVLDDTSPFARHLLFQVSSRRLQQHRKEHMRWDAVALFVDPCFG